MFKINYVCIVRHNGTIVGHDEPARVFLRTLDDCAEFRRLAESLPIQPKAVMVGPPLKSPWVIEPTDINEVLERLKT